MITLDSASGNLEIPKIYDYQLLMENSKLILNIDDELFKYLYFSYFDEKEQERIRLNPQIFDDFISYDSPTLSIGFLDNVDENIVNQFIEIIDSNKKRFKEMGWQISEEDLPINKKIIINEDINLEKDKENDIENDIEIKKDENENKIDLEKENEEEIKKDENKIILEKENEVEIKKDENNIILEKENEIEIKKDDDINSEKENKIEIIKDEDNNSDKENKIEIIKDEDNNSNKANKIEIRKDDDIILDKENINSININLINNQIKEKIPDSDNFNLFDSDNIKKININSDSFLKIQNNNNFIKIDSNNLGNIDSSEINLIKFDKNNSNSFVFEENKEIEEDEFNKNIENIISSNIDNIKDDIIHSILLESSKIQQKTKINKVNPTNNYIHKNYECDICKMHPIKGIRYHCLECKDYDICEKCEEKFSHQHPLYKVKNDKSCRFKNENLN